MERKNIQQEQTYIERILVEATHSGFLSRFTHFRRIVEFLKFLVKVVVEHDQKIASLEEKVSSLTEELNELKLENDELKDFQENFESPEGEDESKPHTPFTNSREYMDNFYAQYKAVGEYSNNK